MQVPVYVSIKANVKDTDDCYYLTEEELNNKVDLSASAAGAAPLSRVSGQDKIDDSYQLKYYWVSTTKSEDRNIAARITQPDGKIATPETSTEGFCVTLVGITTTTVEIVPEAPMRRYRGWF
ncbi:hypothetical protein BBP40_003334 [Aspergillus hancockii]|nr:hypothetical protein BBP40_003334 [Aspergillus hancockii]